MPIPTKPPSRPADVPEPLAHTLPEAARISGLSISTLRRHWKRGALECPRVVDARSLRRLNRGDAG